MNLQLLVLWLKISQGYYALKLSVSCTVVIPLPEHFISDWQEDPSVIVAAGLFWRAPDEAKRDLPGSSPRKDFEKTSRTDLLNQSMSCQVVLLAPVVAPTRLTKAAPQ